MQTEKINTVKSNPDNPRLIKDDKFKKLVTSLKEFPEMAAVRPIVVNTDMVVLGGNMRLKAMKEAGWKDVPIEIVDWSEDKQREFIVKDNVGFGEWNWDDLANEWNAEDLESWGLDVPIFDEEIDGLEDGEEIELPQSVQLEPPKEYILIMAEPNSVEWEDLKQTLKLGMVRRGGYKEGSPLDNIALERVMNWTDLKERLNVNSSTK